MSEDLAGTLKFAIPFAAVHICALITPIVVHWVLQSNAAAARERQIELIMNNKPVAYLDGELVDLDKLDVRAYHWDYDEEANVVKFGSH